MYSSLAGVNVIHTVLIRRVGTLAHACQNSCATGLLKWYESASSMIWDLKILYTPKSHNITYLTKFTLIAST